MTEYIFILGRNPVLSQAEILAVLRRENFEFKIISQTDNYLIIETQKLLLNFLKELGGTIKFGQVISEKIEPEIIINELVKNKKSGKINFGFSYYKTSLSDYGEGISPVESRRDLYGVRVRQPESFGLTPRPSPRSARGALEKIGLEIKKKLKELGISSRLVVSREPVLSSVVVAKNKCQEFLILDEGWLGKTLAVQEFEEYGFRDYGRPARDILSGTLPPKLAKIMLNLAELPKDAKILDPFCGSGTILQEAALLGYQNIIGSDVSDKALKDTENNLRWLKSNYSSLPITHYSLFNVDVRNLSKKIKPGSIDAIITEPYLGPPLKGRETEEQLLKIIKELEILYLKAFLEFKKVLRPGGKVVIIFPVFRVGGQNLNLNILPEIKKSGFENITPEKLIYCRPDQMVLREILIFRS